MILKKLATLIVMGSVLSGCTVIRTELRNSGGYPGHLLDKRIFNASRSKQLQLLRAAMIVALASRVGTAYIRNGVEADAFASYLDNATRELNALAGNVYSTDKIDICSGVSATSPVTCPGYTALFESEVPALEYKIARLVVAALPEREASNFVSAIAKGDGISAAWKALWLGAKLVDGFHRGAATYRSTQEILAQAVLTGNNSAGKNKCENRISQFSNPNNAKIATIEEAVACLGLSNTAIFENPNELQASEYPTKISKDVFVAVFAITQTSCRMLPVDIDQSGTPTSTEENAKKITARKDTCARLTFKPELRFGTVSEMSTLSKADGQGQAPPQAQVGQPLQPAPQQPQVQPPVLPR